MSSSLSWTQNMTGNSRWSRHSFKNEARWTQLVNAFWKKSAYACLFDTLFRTLGRLEPKWIVGRFNVWKTSYYISLHQRQCHLQERCIEPCSFCLWVYSVWRCWVQNSRLNRWNSAAHNFRRFRDVGLFAQPPKPRRPTAPGESAWGATPVHVAAFNGHVEAVELLLSKGAAVDAKGDDSPGPRRQEAGPEILSLQLGALQKVFRAWNSAERCLHFQ